MGRRAEGPAMASPRGDRRQPAITFARGWPPVPHAAEARNETGGHRIRAVDQRGRAAARKPTFPRDESDMTTTLRVATTFAVLLLGGCEPDVIGPTKADTILLASGVPVTGLSAQLHERKYYRIPVPARAAHLAITTSGGTGDVDLIVRYNDIPRVDNGHCGSVGEENTESCTFDNPPPGDWYIMLYGSAPYTGVTLTATVTPGS